MFGKDKSHIPAARDSYGRMIQNNFRGHPKAKIGHPDVYRIMPSKDGGFRMMMNEQVPSRMGVQAETECKVIWFTGDEFAHLVEHAKPYMEVHAAKRKKADAILAKAMEHVSPEDLELLKELGHNIS
ncbi:MAG: hypothetical protein COB09_18715 [Thalassobium sp.]|nr:MAG: hypothetical protein COB09_18715 [Thalassobium sp.]